MAQGNQTVVLKVDEPTKKKLIMFYQDSLCDKTPMYAVFQAKIEDCVITLYESGKLMFQGKKAEEESIIWSAMGAKDASKAQTSSSVASAKAALDTAIGSDEVGTGDFFGPIVVTAAYVTKDQFDWLISLGVRDSKKLTDDKIKKIAPQLTQKVEHVTRVLSNQEYNDMRARDINMNQIKAILHNECLYLLRQQVKEDVMVVVDQFEPQSAYEKHVKGQEHVLTGITFMTKAEDQCMAVACASIISRFEFLQQMQKLGEELGYPEGLPFGASAAVDAFAATLVEEQGEDILPKVVKMNFANVEKVRSLL